MLGEGTSAERCEALIGLGEAQRLVGDAAYRETLLEASRIAAALADPQLSANAALANSRGFNSVIGQVDQERLAAIERAIELDDRADAGRRARLLTLEAMELGWDKETERRSARIEEAIGLARETDDARTLGEVLRSVFYADWSPATLERRVAIAEELARCAAEVQDPALQWWALEIDRINSGEQGRLGHVQASSATRSDWPASWASRR